MLVIEKNLKRNISFVSEKLLNKIFIRLYCFHYRCNLQKSIIKKIKIYYFSISALKIITANYNKGKKYIQYFLYFISRLFILNNYYIRAKNCFSRFYFLKLPVVSKL